MSFAEVYEVGAYGPHGEYLTVAQQYSEATCLKGRFGRARTCVLCGDSALPHCHLHGDRGDWAWPCRDDCDCIGSVSA